MSIEYANSGGYLALPMENPFLTLLPSRASYTREMDTPQELVRVGELIGIYLVGLLPPSVPNSSKV